MLYILPSLYVNAIVECTLYTLYALVLSAFKTMHILRVNPVVIIMTTTRYYVDA